MRTQPLAGAGATGVLLKVYDNLGGQGSLALALLPGPIPGGGAMWAAFYPCEFVCPVTPST